MGQSRLVVFGRAEGAIGHAVGVQVSREAGTQAKIDGTVATSLAELSTAVPVQVINPEIHRLIEEGPSRRRRWLDWAVFHVEPAFAGHWVQYQRALRQRNAALRTSGADLSAWSRELMRQGEPLNVARQRVVERLKPHWDDLCARLCGVGIRVGFQQGWSEDLTLEQALAGAERGDRERGSTTVGPHRADLTLRVEGRAARDILSRGQQKLAAIALTLAQLELLRADSGLQPTLLLDDPEAELDDSRLESFLAHVRRLDCQLIVTSLRPDFDLLGTPERRFHVEQGRIEQG
jgi:DNA replication and repair protein RecF